MRPVSIVAGLFDLELLGMERELLGISDWHERPVSGTREDARLRAESGFVLALFGTPYLSILAEFNLPELSNQSNVKIVRKLLL